MIDEATYAKIYPTSKVIPRFYATPKIHKKDNPVRPIVSGINSITYGLAKHLAKLLKPLVGKTQHHIKNSKHLVDMIHNLRIEDDEVMTSFDVSALFTSVPCKEVVEMCVNRVKQDPTWSQRSGLTPEEFGDLLELTLDTTYFQHQGQVYQQVYGAAMGSPLSPVIANIFMEEFELKAISTANHPPKFWGRYVDDTATITKKSHVQALFQHINEQHHSISFTIEEEDEEGALPVLDVKMIKDSNRIKTDVYRKATHTDHYLQWSSHHPVSQKLSVPASLYHRCESVISDDNMKRVEREKIKSDLTKCGYPKWALTQGEKKRKERQDNAQQELDNTKKAKTCVVIPYTRGMSERLSRVYKKHGISMFSKPGYTLRQALVAPKDPLTKDEKCGVVYSLKCETCDSEYVGETIRPLSTRMKEHRDSVAKRNTKSALGEHIINNPGHNINFEDTKVIDSENKTLHRKVVEAIHIRDRNPSLNRQGGYDLPKIYTPLLRGVERGGHAHPVVTTLQGPWVLTSAMALIPEEDG